MAKKHSKFKIIAIITACVGILVAVVAFLKRKSRMLGEELDFDDSYYLDEEEMDEMEQTAKADSDETEESADEEETVDDMQEIEQDNVEDLLEQLEDKE